MDPSALAIFAVMRSIVMRRSVLPVTLDRDQAGSELRSRRLKVMG